MKKLFILSFLCLFILSSCREPLPPKDLLYEFVKSYGAEGIIYHSEAKEGEEGYLSPELERLAFGDRHLPGSYAVLLNTHLDTAAECGLFIIEGNREELIDLCTYRTALLDTGGERTYIAIFGDYMFYSTLPDRDRAKRLADKVFLH